MPVRAWRVYCIKALEGSIIEPADFSPPPSTAPFGSRAFEFGFATRAFTYEFASRAFEFSVCKSHRKSILGYYSAVQRVFLFRRMALSASVREKETRKKYIQHQPRSWWWKMGRVNALTAQQLRMCREVGCENTLTVQQVRVCRDVWRQNPLTVEHLKMCRGGGDCQDAHIVQDLRICRQVGCENVLSVQHVRMCREVALPAGSRKRKAPGRPAYEGLKFFGVTYEPFVEDQARADALPSKKRRRSAGA